MLHILLLFGFLMIQLSAQISETASNSPTISVSASPSPCVISCVYASKLSPNYITLNWIQTGTCMQLWINSGWQADGPIPPFTYYVGNALTVAVTMLAPGWRFDETYTINNLPTTNQLPCITTTATASRSAAPSITAKPTMTSSISSSSTTSSTSTPSRSASSTVSSSSTATVSSVLSVTTTQPCTTGCVGPLDTSFYLSGSQTEGISAFSTINNPNGISFTSNLSTFPSTALVLSSGSYLSSPLLSTIPTNSSPFTVSSWVNCNASLYTDINPSGVVISWGKAQLSTNNSLLTSATLAVTSIERGQAEVTTLAGTGSQYSVDGIGLSAGFNYPYGLAIDMFDFIYVSDFNSKKVRKISPDGQVSTLATLLSETYGIAVSPNTDRTVYVTSNRAVYKISQAGSVSIFANGFNSPQGIAVDLSNNVYVADAWAHLILKISSSGVVSTLAGSGNTPEDFENFGGYADGVGVAARFGRPHGVAVDSSGFVYVADSYNLKLRKITPFGNVTTLNGPGGDAVAIDVHKNIYQLELGSLGSYQRVVVTTKSGYVYTLAGGSGPGFADGIGTNAKFNVPMGIAVDSKSEYLYVAEFSNHRIRKIRIPSFFRNQGIIPICDSTWHHIAVTYSGADTLKILTTYIDGSSLISSFSLFETSPSSTSTLRIGWNGIDNSIDTESFIGSISDIRIFNRELSLTEIINISQPFLTTYPNAINPSPIAKSSFYLWQCSAGYFGPSLTLTRSILTGLWSFLGGPVNCQPCDADKYSYGSITCARCSTKSTIISSKLGCQLKSNFTNGPLDTSFYLSGSQTEGISAFSTINNPNGISFTSNLSTFPSTALVLSSGSYLSSPLLSTIPTNSSPFTVSSWVNCNASLYTDINPSGVVISWGKAQSSSSSITAATLAVTSSERVKSVATVFTFAGGVNQGFANGTGTNAMFNSPRGVIVDDFGIVYVADTNNNRIRSISPEGIVNSIAGQESSGSDDGVGTDARFNQPWSLVVDSFKNMFVSDCNNNRVRKITYSGNVTTITGSSEGFVDGTLSEAKFNRPKGLVFNTFGKLFVADNGNNRIRLIDISGNNVSTFAFLFRPSGIAFDAISEVLYVTDELFSVSKISSSGNVERLNDFFNAPFGIIVTPARLMLVFTYQGIYQTSLIGSGSTTVLVQGLYCYGIAIDKSGNFFLTDSSSIRRMSLSPFIPGPLPVCDSLWHSIALTFSGSTSGNVLMAYIDGKQIASTSASFVIPSTLSTNLLIGSNSDKSELFNGLISDVQIFNRSLSPIEVHTLSVPVMTNSLASAFFTPSASATQSSTPASSASAFATTTTTTTSSSSSSSTMSPAVSSSTTSSVFSSPTSSITGTSSTTVSSTGTSSSTVTSSLTSSSSSSSTVSSSMSSTGTSSMTSSSSISVSITGTSSSTTTQTASSSPTLSSSATATSSPTISASASATASASFSVTRTATTSTSSSDLRSFGPVMLLDIYPGSYSSVPSSMTVYKNKLYFTANDALNGNELWASDGTSAGTLLFKDINPGPSDSYPLSLIVFNDKLYFTANDTHVVELWSTDGTNSGTSIVRDINPGFEGSNPYYLTVFDSKLYFRASDGINGYELWCSDGTSLGTTMVKDINPALGNSYPLTLTVFNSKLYFAAIDGTSTSDDFELWSSDGTGLGTSRVGNINSGSIDFGEDSFTVYNSKMYFTVTDSAGNELWFTDGINIAMVKDINPGSASSRPSFLTVFNDKLYFAANDGSNGYELMTTDGIDVSMVKDINPGSASSSPSYLTVYKNKLYFSANYVTSGGELWCSDGTEQGTILVKDIYPGIGSSSPRQFKVFKNNLYFIATDGTYGNELWISDGSLSGTFLVKDINPGIGGGSPLDLIMFNNKLYFSAIDGMNGYELWVMAAETPYSTSLSTFTPLPSTTTSKTSSSTSTPSQTSCPTRSSTRTSTTSSTATSSKNDFLVTTQSCLTGCSSLLNKSSFYFSGSQSDGFPIYSTIVNPNSISFTTIPTTALVLSSGSYLSSPLLPTLPTGSSPFTISSWVKCDASSYTDINPSGVVIAWGEAQLSTNNSLLTSATLAVTSIERGEASVTTLAGSGAQYTFDGTGASAGFNYPWGIAVDMFGYIYVADMNSNSIRKVTPLGQVVTIASGFSNPYGVAVNSLGTKVYVSSSNSVRVVLKNGELWNNYGPSSILASGFNGPFGLAVDSFENVYVADVFNHRICKISSNGVVSTLAGSGTTPDDFENYGGHADGPGITARFARPYGVAVDTIGNVYVADTYNGKLRKITPSGEVSTLPGPGGWGIAIDSLGNIYQADAGFHRIVVTTPLGQVKTLAGSGTSGFADGTGTNAIFNIPYGVAVDSSGETVFVSEFSNHRVRKILVPKFPGPLPVCDSFWHHIALTYSNTVSAYIDGAHFLSKAVIYNIKKSLEIATIRVFSNTYPAACPGGTFIHFAPSFLEIKLLTSSGHNIALSSAGAKASVDSHVDDRGDCGCLSQSSTRLTEMSLYLIDGSTLTGWNGRGAYGGCVRCTCSTSPWARVDIASSNIGTIATIEILGGPSGNPGSSGANTLDETYNNVNNYFSIEALSNTGEVLQKVTMASLGGIKNTVTSTIKWTWSINSVLNTTLRIGWNGMSTNSELFTGSIRDVRIFNTSLNQSEIHVLRGITSGASTSPTTSSSASQSVSPSSSSSSSGTASSSSSTSSSRSPMATKTSQSSISSSRTSSTTSSVSVSATSTSSATTTTTTTTSPTSSTNNASILSVLSTPSAVISSTSLSLLCLPGTYSLQTGSLPCVSCPSNTYSYTGATSCSSCSIGSILISSSLGCRLISSSNRGPIDTTFYLSGSQSEGISAFSTINNPNGISFLSNLNSFPTTALVLSSGSYLSSPLLPTLPTGSSPFTISSWVKCDASFYTDINPSGVVIAWGEAQLSTNNSLLTSATLAVTSSTKSTGISSLPGPLPVCDSTWHNIVLSFTRTTSLSQNRRRLSTTSSMGALTAYIDGSKFASSLVNLSISSSSSSSTFRIGTNGLVNGELFSGSISDLRIFNRSINESEILSLRSITIIPSISPVESNPSSSSSSSLSFALIGGSIAALIFVIGGSFVLVNWIKRRKILIEESLKLKEETLAKDVSVEIVENDTINDFENNRSGWRITSLSSTPPSNISSTSISLASSRVTAYEDKREGALKEVLKTPTSSSLNVSTSIEGRNSNSQKKTSIDDVNDDLILATKREFPEDDEDDDALLPGAISKIKDGETQELIEEYNLQGLLNGTSEGEGGVMSSLLTSAGSALESLAVASVSIPLVGLALKGLSMLCNQVEAFSQSNLEAEKLLGRLTRLQTVVQKASLDVDFCNEHSGIFDYMVKTLKKAADKLEIISKRSKLGKFVFAQSDIEIMERVDRAIMMHLTELQAAMQSQTMNMVKALHDGFVERSTKNEEEVKSAPLQPFSMRFKQSDIIFDPPLEKQLLTAPRGSFGVVVFGIWKAHNLPCAVKLISSRTATGVVAVSMMSWLSEAELMRRLREHLNSVTKQTPQNICTLFGIGAIESKTGEVTQYMVVMERLEGSLRDKLDSYLKKKRHPPLLQALTWIRDVAMGINECHDANVVHSDLKAANALLSKKNDAKLCDLGAGRVTRDMTATSSMINSTGGGIIRGSLPWLSSELLEDQSLQPSKASDVYAWACVCWEILSCRIPYHDDEGVLAIDLNKLKNLSAIVNGKLRPDLSALRADAPSSIVNIMQKAWDPEPRDRPQIGEILETLQSALASFKETKQSNSRRAAEAAAADLRSSTLLTQASKVEEEDAKKAVEDLKALTKSLEEARALRISEIKKKHDDMAAKMRIDLELEEKRLDEEARREMALEMEKNEIMLAQRKAKWVDEVNEKKEERLRNSHMLDEKDRARIVAEFELENREVEKRVEASRIEQTTKLEARLKERRDAKTRAAQKALLKLDLESLEAVENEEKKNIHDFLLD